MAYQFVRQYFPNFFKTYCSYSYGIQRANALKPLILYHYGGVFSDLDLIPKRNVLPLLQLRNYEQVLILRHYSNDNLLRQNLRLIEHNNYEPRQNEPKGKYDNKLMASVPQAKFWLFVIEEMKYGGLPFGSVQHCSYIDRTTGKECINMSTAKYRDYKEIGWFDPGLVYPVPYDKELPHSIEGSYFIVTAGRSWKGFDSKWSNYSQNNLLVILAIVILFIVFVVYILYWFYYYNLCDRKHR
jgi:mannosyltransferase OCH1-like enzyme